MSKKLKNCTANSISFSPTKKNHPNFCSNQRLQLTNERARRKIAAKHKWVENIDDGRRNLEK